MFVCWMKWQFGVHFWIVENVLKGIYCYVLHVIKRCVDSLKMTYILPNQMVIFYSLFFLAEKSLVKHSTSAYSFCTREGYSQYDWKNSSREAGIHATIKCQEVIENFCEIKSETVNEIGMVFYVRNVITSTIAAQPRYSDTETSMAWTTNQTLYWAS